MRIWTTLLAITTLNVAAQTVVPVGDFEAVELHDGGHVVVRAGAVPRVTVVRGDSRNVQITVEGQRLVIRNEGKHRRGERMEIEVVTPELTAVSVSNGGTVQTAGSFSARPAITARVEQGGTIDIRSVAADAVVASVDSGGRIFTHARRTLDATVRSGGAITYWGAPQVSRSVRHGGMVARGTARVDQPLSELDPKLPVISPVPPVPPIR